MVKVKRTIKNIIQRIFGYHLLKIPFGIDPFNDIDIDFKDYNFRSFFDVGAYVGQVAQKIIKKFPNASVWCFEPVGLTFETLKKNTKNTNIKCYKLGLGSRNAK